MKITNFLEGDSAICESEYGIMNKSAPTVSRRSTNQHVTKKDHLALRKEQKRKDRRVAVREERKQRDILLTTKEDLFANLPEEITLEILGRLTIRSVMTCKCVLKSWRHLMEGDEFAMSYTPKPGLTFVHRDMEMGYTVRDEALKPLFRFGLPSDHRLSGVHWCAQIASANGLLSVWDPPPNTIFICNPMTREYVELPPQSKDTITSFFGFGVSRTSGQYKILCVDSRSCYVFTLGRGAGLWRTIAPPPAPALGIGQPYLGDAAFLNGNLHWLALDSEEDYFVCCFDLETELFTRISVPCDYIANRCGNRWVYILEGRLCLYVVLDWRHVIIWKMNNYGDDNSWIKEYSFDLLKKYSSMDVVEVLANGDLLLAIAGSGTLDASHDRLFYINPKNTGAVVTYGSKQRHSSNIGVYTPTLISLVTMGFHNVQPLNFIRCK